MLSGRDPCRTACRARRGGADPALRRVGAVGARLRRGGRGRARRRPVRARGDHGAAAAARVRGARAIDAALHDLQGKLVGRPVYQLLGLPRVGPPTSWTIWLGDPDDMARRAEAGRRTLQAAEAEARRPATGATSSACARCARSRDVPLQVDVNEAWSARRGARRAAAARGARRRSTASSRSPPATPAGRAEGALADPDLRRRGLPHARATSPRAPSARTASTSSSRSPAASARRCGWCTPRARSGSAACSAA